MIYSIIIGSIANFASIYSSPYDNLTPNTKLMPLGLKTYTNFLDYNYTQLQYRILTYLIGLLAGFILYKNEHTKLSSSRKAPFEINNISNDQRTFEDKQHFIDHGNINDFD